MSRSIVPKLSWALQSILATNPMQPDLAALQWVLAWQDVMPKHLMVALFEGSFFPSWHGVLRHWLSGSPNFDEVTSWYIGWKVRSRRPTPPSPPPLFFPSPGKVCCGTGSLAASTLIRSRLCTLDGMRGTGHAAFPHLPSATPLQFVPCWLPVCTEARMVSVRMLQLWCSLYELDLR